MYWILSKVRVPLTSCADSRKPGMCRQEGHTLFHLSCSFPKPGLLLAESCV